MNGETAARLIAAEGALADIEGLAKVQALACQRAHRADHARNWLEVLAIIERAGTDHTPSPATDDLRARVEKYADEVEGSGRRYGYAVAAELRALLADPAPQAAASDSVRDQVLDVITLLGARLDQMRADSPPSTDDWSRGFDDGWNGARLQINPSILNPRIAEHIRGAIRTDPAGS